MSAKLVESHEMSPDLHKMVFDIVQGMWGTAWANVLVGPMSASVKVISLGDWEVEVVTDDVAYSLDEEICITCERPIEEHETLECLFEYEDGEPAFYMCPSCETASLILKDKKS
jgi:hypothetical protein